MKTKQFAAVSGDLVLTNMDSREGCYLLTSDSTGQALVVKNWDHLVELSRKIIQEDSRRFMQGAPTDER